MAKGFKSGGRGPRTPNKKTVARLAEASQQIGQIKKAGQRKATEILNELMQTGRGMVALYQRLVVTEDGRALLPGAKPDDITNFFKALEVAGILARSLAPYQDPKIMQIEMKPEQIPGMRTAPAPEIKAVEGKVITIDDPAALARFYANRINKVV